MAIVMMKYYVCRACEAHCILLLVLANPVYFSLYSGSLRSRVPEAL